MFPLHPRWARSVDVAQDPVATDDPSAPSPPPSRSPVRRRLGSLWEYMAAGPLAIVVTENANICKYVLCNIYPCITRSKGCTDSID